MSSAKDARCLICRSGKYKVIYSYNEPDQYERAVGIDIIGYWRQWVQCIDCGFFYSRYSRPENALDNIYISTYRSEKSSWRDHTTEKIFHYVISLPLDQSETKYRVNWIKSQLRIIKNSDFNKNKEPPYRMLDIGGGTGVFAYEFRDQDWLPYVIDPNESGLFIKHKFKIPYKQKFYAPECFGEAFDLITLIFVLEHHRDPISLLKLIQKDMRADSFFYVEVPDAICFKYKLPDDDIFNSCHLWMFAPNTIIRLFECCELDIYCIQRIKTIRGHYSLMIIGGLK